MICFLIIGLFKINKQKSRQRNLKKFLVVCYPFIDLTVAKIWKRYFGNEVMIWPAAGEKRLSPWKVKVNNRKVDVGGDDMDLDCILEMINVKYPKTSRLLVQHNKRLVIVVMED